MWKCEIVADSFNIRQTRLTTFNLRIPRIILPELRTHRMLSYNVGSSRAIPTKKIIKQVEDNPFVPIYWGKNCRGMSSKEELDELDIQDNKVDYYNALDAALESAKNMEKRGTHKQIINRILEPYMWVYVVVSGTDWDNFFNLRTDTKTVEPHMCKIARLMRIEFNNSSPEYLKRGQWHLPFVTAEDYAYPIEYCIKFSVARVARTSYHNHDGSEPNIEKDIELYEKLKSSRHLSCFEHQATPRFSILFKDKYFGNFRNWWQHRKDIPNESGIK